MKLGFRQLFLSVFRRKRAPPALKRIFGEASKLAPVLSVEVIHPCGLKNFCRDLAATFRDPRQTLVAVRLAFLRCRGASSSKKKIVVKQWGRLHSERFLCRRDLNLEPVVDDKSHFKFLFLASKAQLQSDVLLADFTTKRPKVTGKCHHCANPCGLCTPRLRRT